MASHSPTDGSVSVAQPHEPYVDTSYPPKTPITPHPIKRENIPINHRGDDEKEYYDFDEKKGWRFTILNDVELYLMGSIVYAALADQEATLPLLHFIELAEDGLHTYPHYQYLQVIEGLVFQPLKLPNHGNCQVKVFMLDAYLFMETHFPCEPVGYWRGELALIHSLLEKIASGDEVGDDAIVMTEDGVSSTIKDEEVSY